MSFAIDTKVKNYTLSIDFGRMVNTEAFSAFKRYVGGAVEAVRCKISRFFHSTRNIFGNISRILMTERILNTLLKKEVEPLFYILPDVKKSHLLKIYCVEKSLKSFKGHRKPWNYRQSWLPLRKMIKGFTSFELFAMKRHRTIIVRALFMEMNQ